MKRETIKLSRSDLDGTTRALAGVFTQLIAVLTPAQQVAWIEMLRQLCLAECTSYNQAWEDFEKGFAARALVAEEADEPVIVEPERTEMLAAS